MQELRGVVFAGQSSADLKRRALLFDKFHIWHLNGEEFAKSEEYETELDFLRSNQIVIDEPPVDVHEFAETMLADSEDVKRVLNQILHSHRMRGANSLEQRAEGTMTITRDNLTRMVATKISRNDSFELVPILELSLPDTLPTSKAFEGSGKRIMTDLAAIALKNMPTPDDSCSWQDIMDFKKESADKRWGFRRWLKSLSTENLTEAEVTDEIEWMLDEYRRAMKIHHIKASESFVDVFVISPLEILENIVKFNWSKIAKGALSVKKRKIELLEAEMKAPGRECAYIFDARKKFDSKI
jgi:hypothetical protein